MSFRLIISAAIIILSAPAYAGTALHLSSALSVYRSPIQIGVFLPPRLEKIHLSTSIMTECNTSPCDSYYSISQAIHHDGDPALLTLSNIEGAGHGTAYVLVGMVADSNANGSYANGYTLRSRATGRVVGSSSCSSPYYCSLGFTFAAGGYGSNGNGLPQGSYDLTVTYHDGTYAVHTLVLEGIYGSGGYGETQVSTPSQFSTATQF